MTKEITVTRRIHAESKYIDMVIEDDPIEFETFESICEAIAEDAQNCFEPCNGKTVTKIEYILERK